MKTFQEFITEAYAIEEGMTLKDYKKKRSALKQKEKRASDKIAPNRRAGIHADKASPERAARHRANVDPDFEGNDERNYPGGKLRAKKVRKAKALGELGEQMNTEPTTAPAIDQKKELMDKQKLSNLKMLQQKKQMLDRQRLQMQKSGRLPLEAG